MRKLPVFQSFREVYSGVYAHFFELLRVAWLPLAIWLLVSVFGAWWSVRNFPINQVPNANEMAGLSIEQMKAAQVANAAAMLKVMPQLYGFLFFQYIAMSIVAVGFHRFVLLGERDHGWRGSGFDFGRSEILYIWSTIKIGLVVVLSIGVVVGLTIGIAFVFLGSNRFKAGGSGEVVFILSLFVGSPVVAIALMPVMARLSLVLPHVALGNPSQMKFIWNGTKGNGWRLVGYFLLVTLCAMLVSIIALLPVNSLLRISLISTPDALRDLVANPWKLVMRSVVSMPITLAWAMLTVTMLSVAYREIVGLPAEGSAGAAGEAAPA